jgi:hypothetical protein
MRLHRSGIALLVIASIGSVSHGQMTIDYAKDVEPIFKAHCFGCHGEEKGLGRLRLHSADAIKESLGVHDDLLVAGKIDQSELYQRVALPAGDKKLMPKGGDPLPEANVATIKKWIEEGAVFEVTAAAPATEPVEEEVAPKKDLPKRPELEPASPDAIAAAEKTGALVIPLYAGANELRVSFPSSRDQVTDETVVALVPLVGQLVELDISGTKITDACADTIKQFTNLDTLHLEKTEVGDATVAALVDMQYLNYLNLHSTNVTDGALESLKSMPSLEKLYLWQTSVSYDAAKALEKATPGLEANLGWDHPGVVRERLNEELARVEKQQTESAAAVTEAEKALAAAKAEQTTAEERAAEIKKELETLDKPAEQPPAAPAEGAEQQPGEQQTADANAA